MTLASPLSESHRHFNFVPQNSALPLRFQKEKSDLVEAGAMTPDTVKYFETLMAIYR